MFDNLIFSNDFFTLVEEEKTVYIKVLNKGYNLNEFQELNKLYPRIKITQFVNLRAAIMNGMEKFIAIGDYRDVVELTVSKDRFTAFATINLTESQYECLNMNEIVDIIVSEAGKLGIQTGLDVPMILDNMKVIEPFEIAIGIEPIQGKDAKIRLYEIEEAKPEIFQDGKVNHYELNLINKVVEGEWVGERIEPTEGMPGRTVFDEIIPAVPGKQERLIFDRKTIRTRYDENKGITTLLAKRVGAVVYENGVLTVCNYLEITGKVSFETGNIDFDGYVDIKDTVEDNFSVIADNDIQVMGSLGVGAVDSIESREGSIYVRGGIAGQNKAVITCDGDLYTKFASDCTIICKGTVHIGYYAFNCNIQAKEVILDGINSRIVGGKIEADVRVYAGEIGSKSETHTNIVINGFNRQAMRDEYDTLGVTIEKLRDMAQLLKQKIAIYQNTDPSELENDEIKSFEQMESDYLRCQKSLKIYAQKKKNYVAYLHAKGEGEIKANRLMYPNVHLKLKKNTIHNGEMKRIGVSYYIKGDEVKSDI